MTETFESRRQSIYQNVQKIAEKSSKRLSMFELSDEVFKKESQNWVEEWNTRWGHEKKDYGDVIIYPENYVRKLKEEIYMWANGLEEMVTREQEFAQQCEYIDVIEDCEFETDEKITLQDIDSKINEFVKQSKMLLNSMEVFQQIENLKLQEINREIKLTDKLIVFKASCK